MSAQNFFNPSDFEAVGSSNGFQLRTSPHLYYLQIEGQNIENPLESQAGPLNLLLNSHTEHLLLPFSKSRELNDQLCVYMDPTEIIDDQTILNYINNQRLLPTNGNVQALPITTEASGSSQLTAHTASIPASSTSAKGPSEVNVQDNAEATKLPEKKSRKLNTAKVQGFVHLLDRPAPPRAVAVLPAALQMLRGGVSPKRPLPERVRFGPVQGVVNIISSAEACGKIREAAISQTPIFLLKNSDSIKHIDVSDKDKSNWFGLLPLGTQSSANVWLYEEDGKLYGITVQSVMAKTPLALGYSKQYEQEHQLPPGLPILDLLQDFPEAPRRSWCYECHRALPTASHLQLHVEMYHKEKMTSKRRYRCRHCTRTFGRLFTLKRHIARYCCKKPNKPENFNKTCATPDLGLNTSLNVEDNRLPSDESLQNYTNGLDFSTNLFDTDRIPGLDISGSSRSETEFNTYGPDLELGKLATDLDSIGNENQEKAASGSNEQLTMLISCPYCKQTILREKKRKHLKECPEKKFKCDCGVTFDSAERLGQHVHSGHSDNTTSKSDNEQSDNCEYKCEKCEQTFKRRGMFVNHMWRVHKAATLVPVARRVRHYPCGACPKLYRTAAKRDLHRLHHHPGADLIRGQAIEGGRRACSPAACEACPRQYATRAKLLQHVRAHHPDLAPPLQKKRKPNNISRNHK